MFDALRELGFSDDFDMDERIFASSAVFWEFVIAHTPKRPGAERNQVNLLLIDQFEEVFTAEPAQRDRLLDILANPPSFNQCRTHIVVTLRSDYLKAASLLTRPALLQLASSGISLLGLDEKELCDAIQLPVVRRKEGRQVEASLISLLSEQVIPNLHATSIDKTPRSDPRLLPLLQVTLEGLWTSGWMKLDAYKSKYDEDIARALQRNATAVLEYIGGDPAQPRPPSEKQLILELLLELTQLPLDDPRLDSRRQRRRADLIAASPLHERLLNELVSSRLVIVDTVKLANGESESVVDLIHESLMLNWAALHAAIENRRSELLRWRERFITALAAWQEAGQPESSLLSGSALNEATRLQACSDGVASEAAANFIRLSVEVKGQSNG